MPSFGVGLIGMYVSFVSLQWRDMDQTWTAGFLSCPFSGDHQKWVKGATSQEAGSPAVPDRAIIVLDRTVIVLDQIVIVLDRSVIAIYGFLSLNFLRPGGGSDRLWWLRAARHTSTPALPTVSCLSGDRYVNKTLPRAGLFPGARSCAFKSLVTLHVEKAPRGQ